MKKLDELGFGKGTPACAQTQTTTRQGQHQVGISVGCVRPG